MLAVCPFVSLGEGEKRPMGRNVSKATIVLGRALERHGSVTLSRPLQALAVPPRAYPCANVAPEVTRSRRRVGHPTGVPEALYEWLFVGLMRGSYFPLDGAQSGARRTF